MYNRPQNQNIVESTVYCKYTYIYESKITMVLR